MEGKLWELADAIADSANYAHEAARRASYWSHDDDGQVMWPDMVPLVSELNEISNRLKTILPESVLKAIQDERSEYEHDADLADRNSY